MRKVLTCALVVGMIAASTADAGWDEGVAAFTSGDFTQAAAEFQAVVTQNPDEWRAHFMLGLSFERLRRTEEALSHLRKAYDLNPNDLSVRMSLGRSYSTARRYPEAVQLLSTIDPGTLPAPQQAGLFQVRGQARYRTGDAQGAAADFGALARLKPADPQVQYLYGTAALGAGWIDEGVAALGEASRLVPDDLEKKRAYALGLYRKARTESDLATKKRVYGQAAAVAGLIAVADPTPENLSLQVRAQLGAGLYEEAAGTAQAAVAADRVNWQSHFYLGQALSSTGRLAEAEVALQAALTRVSAAEDESTVLRQLGFNYEKQRNYDAAIEAYGRAGDEASMARARRNQETARDNARIQAENDRIEQMKLEAEELERQLRELTEAADPPSGPVG